jgi:Peptidase M50B-like
MDATTERGETAVGTLVLEPQHLVGKLPWGVAALLGLLALVAVGLPEIWFLTRLVGLVAHEGAHAFMGSSLGHRVEEVRLERDGTGRTLVAGGALMLFIGYLGPSAFGLIAALLIAHGLIVGTLWTGVVLLLILLPTLRGIFSVVLVAAFGALLFIVVRYAPSFLETLTAYALSWILLFGGVRMVLEHGTRAGDADSLRQRTHMPRILWVGLWMIGSVLALAIGCILLV